MKANSFKLAIDHSTNELRLSVSGDDGGNAVVRMTAQQIGSFINILTQCQHAVVLSLVHEEIELPFDPERAFEPEAGGLALGPYEVLAKVTLGIDTELGMVAALILSKLGRLTGLRIEAETARSLGQGLIDTAARVAKPQSRQ
jgi:hypothetical protein